MTEGKDIMKSVRTLYITAVLIISSGLLYGCGSSAVETQETRPMPSVVTDRSESAESGNAAKDTADDSSAGDSGAADSTLPGEPGSSTQTDVPLTLTGEVVITFDFVRQSGSASNQYAVWIEDMGGEVVKSLYASRWTADGGYKTRPDSIFIWAERAGLASMSKEEVDAVSAATPRTGTVSHTWDLTDTAEEAVPPGEYMVFVEGTLRWKNYVLYSARIRLGADPVTVTADALFHYEGTDRYAVLNASSAENDMVGPVTIVFTP